ncbi:DUF6636 domain-containing protein [Arenibacterium sp. CAU 1754]
MRGLLVILCCIATPSLADVWTFETPSENIQCSVGEDGAGSDLFCVIIERHGPDAAPRPAGCTQDWGHSFFMRDRGPVQMVCERFSRNRGGFDRADYGVTGTFGGFTCHSSRSGLQCSNLDGHGFFLSRARQTVF